MWQRRFRSVRRDYSQKRFNNPFFEKRAGSGAWQRRLKAALLAAAVGAGAWYAIFSGRFSPADVEVRGNEQLSATELRAGIREILSERRWLVVPGDNLLFLPEERFIEALNARFVLESVHVESDPLARRLSVTVRERISSILIQLPDGSQAALDLSGEVTRLYRPEEAIDLFPPAGPSKETTARPKFHVLIDDKDEDLDLREKALSPALIQAAIDLPGLISAKFGGSAALRLHIDGKASSTVRAQTGEGWSLYLDAGKPLAEQVENADLVMRTKVGGDRHRLDYIDVRFGEKIFFKLK